MSNRPKAARLKPVNVRLFEDDVKAIQRVAREKGLPWNIELRMLVRRAVRGQEREVTVLKETV